MKLKYYNIAAVLFCLFLVSFNGYGQEKIQNLINVKNNQLKVRQGQVLIDWDILLNGVEVSSNNQLTLTPVIRTNDGRQLNLKPVIVNGKNRNRLYKRSLSLKGVDKDPYVYAVMRAERKHVIMTVPYKTSVPYASWMKNASFYLVEDLCGCAGSQRDYLEKLVANRIGTPGAINFNNYSPKTNFIVPPREKIKERAESGEAYLIFEQSKWDIIPNLFNNRSELAKIERSLNYIKEEPTAVITGISIKAYASPEGTYEDNMKLSKERAKSLLGYIRQEYHLPANAKVASEGFGEDWDRLVDLIKGDPKVENRDQVLKIIQSVDIFDGREKQLMDLSGGRPYLYMLNTLFPLLRRSDYSIHYTVPSFSIEKGKELLRTKPSMLSLEEMYLIANTYEKGTRDFNEVFEIAGRIYPKDRIANLNAAAAAILDKDYAVAKQYLEKYADDSAAWNNLGIVYMSELRLDEAEEYLQKASGKGVEEARQNLKILAEIKEMVEDNKALDEY